jgi:probable rRNA maturation factor
LDADTSQITISNEQALFSLDEDKLKQIGVLIMHALGLSSFELGVRFVDQDEMTHLNATFRNKNQSTDVLSFPQISVDAPITVSTPFRGTEWEVPEPLGDLVISLEDAHRNARYIGQSLSRETAFLMVHGILHLAGHDHMQQEEEARMLEQQRILMNQLEASSPPKWHECVAELN